MKVKKDPPLVHLSLRFTNRLSDYSRDCPSQGRGVITYCGLRDYEFNGLISLSSPSGWIVTTPLPYREMDGGGSLKQSE